MPRIIVYAGSGSSHSWTWLADLFEAYGTTGVHFLDSRQFISSLSRGDVDMAVISGGDGFAIADALRGGGFKSVEKLISNGGTYVGICAGAYLPLPSSVEPFSEFNLSTTKIVNIGCVAKEGASRNPREEMTYGTCSILHPVRGPVEVIGEDGTPFIAPLYGGPVFREPTTDTVLIRYKSFVHETELQLDRNSAEQMMLGSPAAVAVSRGDGRMILIGPHLEHPRYHVANERFLRLLGRAEPSTMSQCPVSRPTGTRHGGLSRSISDLKVAILGLENRAFTVGHKAWDGSRFLEIVSAVEKRQWTLDKDRAELVKSGLDRARDMFLAMTAGTESDAVESTSLLIEAARLTVDHHFAYLAEKTSE